MLESSIQCIASSHFVTDVKSKITKERIPTSEGEAVPVLATSAYHQIDRGLLRQPS